jgi:hypothetical protein
MLETITGFAREDHSSDDMSIVVIMSHGENGTIVSSDGRRVREESILKEFNNQSCPSLTGKPKMFIFSACR